MGSVWCLVLVLTQAVGCQVLLFGFRFSFSFPILRLQRRKGVRNTDEKMALWSGCLGILLYDNPAHTLSLGFLPQLPFCFTRDTF